MFNARYLRPLLTLLLVSSLSGAATSSAQGPESAVEALIRDKLTMARPDLAILMVRPSVASGLYEVQLQSGPMLYATADGDFFVLGDLFSVGIEGIVNLAEQQRDIERKTLLAAVDAEQMIIFPATGKTRATVSVFTDVDCFYCQKLHREVPAMNQAGIEVRYLAYPREGLGGESYRKIATAWCAKDRRQALTQLKNREVIPENVCPGNPVADQFMLGQQVGVRGTPALVLESGEMVPGYLSKDDLVTRLGLK